MYYADDDRLDFYFASILLMQEAPDMLSAATVTAAHKRASSAAMLTLSLMPCFDA